jgi:hypothetical protein
MAHVNESRQDDYWLKIQLRQALHHIETGRATREGTG